MADERVRRILSQVGGGGESKPCGNSASRKEIQLQPGRSTGDIIASRVNASSGHHRGELLSPVRRGGSPSKFDKQTTTTTTCSLGGELEFRMEQEDLGSGGASAAREALMSPAMGVEAGSSARRWPADWPVADDCVFCKIVHGYAPAFKLYEDDYCICILDKNPLSYGHSLLVPKGHFPALDVTPPPIAAAMCSVVPLLSNVIMEATSCDSFNMVVNNGEAAGQVVFHTHFHIVPRFSGDGLWTNESVVRKTLSTFKDPSQLAHAVRSKLRSRT